MIAKDTIGDRRAAAPIVYPAAVPEGYAAVKAEEAVASEEALAIVKLLPTLL